MERHSTETLFGTLVRFTPDGRTKLKSWPQVYETLEKELEQVGGGVVNICTQDEEEPAAFGAIGRYDYLVLAKAPSLQAITQAWLPLVSSGLVVTETIGLIPGRQFHAMIEGVKETVGASRTP